MLHSAIALLAVLSHAALTSAARPTSKHSLRQNGSCSDLDSTELSAAINAALNQLQGMSGWIQNLRMTNEPHGAVYDNAVYVNTCSPDPSIWQYPAKESATGLLRRVLDTGVLRMAGVQWAVESGAADYKTDPNNPTGFWPRLEDAVTSQLGEGYGMNITLQRVYYPSSKIVIQKVNEAAEADISAAYYYVSGTDGSEARFNSMTFSCATAGTKSAFFTSSLSGINSTSQLYRSLENLNSTRTAGSSQIAANSVGFVTRANYEAVAHLLPPDVTPYYDVEYYHIREAVQNGTILAGFSSDGVPVDINGFNYFDSDQVDVRAFLFRKPIKC